MLVFTFFEMNKNILCWAIEGAEERRDNSFTFLYLLKLPVFLNLKSTAWDNGEKTKGQWDCSSMWQLFHQPNAMIRAIHQDFIDPHITELIYAKWMGLVKSHIVSFPSKDSGEAADKYRKNNKIIVSTFMEIRCCRQGSMLRYLTYLALCLCCVFN